MYRNCAACHLVFVSLCFCVFVHWENRLWQDVQKCTLSDSNSSSWANCCLKERHQVVFFCICALCVFVWKLDLWDKMSILSFSLDGWNYLQRMLCEISEAGGSLFITWLGMSVLEVCRSFSSPIDLKSFTTEKAFEFSSFRQFSCLSHPPRYSTITTGGTRWYPKKVKYVFYKLPLPLLKGTYAHNL